MKYFTLKKSISKFLIVFILTTLLSLHLSACTQETVYLPPATSSAVKKTATPQGEKPSDMLPEGNSDQDALASTPEPTPDDTIREVRICVPDGEHLSPYLHDEMLASQNREPIPNMSAPCTTVKAGDANPVGEMVLALVAPFPTVQDEMETADLRAFWQTGKPNVFERLIMFPYAFNALSWLWGEPVGQVKVYDQVDSQNVTEDKRIHEAFLKEAWTTEKTWAIVAVEELEPRWKVIALDGQSPIYKSFKPETYPLTIPLSAYDDDLGQLERALEYFNQWKLAEPFSNFHADKLATVILTGVTALARGTAAGMDERGILVPGEDLAPILREADILHISNEIPFAENCPKQTAGNYLTLCSPKSYLELLKDIGTDVVELTGDHFQDYGSEAMLFTLGLYDQEGWAYYGGGRDVFEARAPIKLEVNGNKIAFLGCNAKSPNFARASETSTGAYHCDMDYMAETTKQLKQEGYLPIVTFQHEEFYEWTPVAWLERDFGSVLEAGAVIASGSQAHQPHYAEFLNGGFAHYGLGNLFFDQYRLKEYTHWGFIDRHVFYQGKHISTELLTIRFLDRVKPTWATQVEREEMLELLFNTVRMAWKDTLTQE